MFVGIKAPKTHWRTFVGNYAVESPLVGPSDVRIDRLDGGILFPTGHLDAMKLGLVWRGCSQATSHPTQDSDHPPIGDDKIAEALEIVIAHLETTIYAHAQADLRKLTLGY